MQVAELGSFITNSILTLKLVILSLLQSFFLFFLLQFAGSADCTTRFYFFCRSKFISPSSHINPFSRWKGPRRLGSLKSAKKNHKTKSNHKAKPKDYNTHTPTHTHPRTTTHTHTHPPILLYSIPNLV